MTYIRKHIIHDGDGPLFYLNDGERIILATQNNQGASIELWIESPNTVKFNPDVEHRLFFNEEPIPDGWHWISSLVVNRTHGQAYSDMLRVAHIYCKDQY